MSHDGTCQHKSTDRRIVAEDTRRGQTVSGGCGPKHTVVISRVLRSRQNVAMLSVPCSRFGSGERVKAGAIAQNFSLKTPEAKFPASDFFKRGLVIEFLALQFWGR
jgi:hypothetical protein